MQHSHSALHHSIETYTGLTFSYSSPTIDLISIHDIAHSLSLQTRYCGHCRFHWSIAAHSILLHDYFKQFYPNNQDILLGALLHDAAEAYIHDIVSPLKDYYKKTHASFKDLEEQIQDLIFSKFFVSLDEEEIQKIKTGDIEVQYAEVLQLIHSKGKTWNFAGIRPANILNADIQIKEYHPLTVEKLFLRKMDLYIDVDQSGELSSGN